MPRHRRHTYKNLRQFEANLGAAEYLRVKFLMRDAEAGGIAGANFTNSAEQPEDMHIRQTRDVL
jgi:hypothetical protein